MWCLPHRAAEREGEANRVQYLPSAVMHSDQHVRRIDVVLLAVLFVLEKRIGHLNKFSSL